MPTTLRQLMHISPACSSVYLNIHAMRYFFVSGNYQESQFVLKIIRVSPELTIEELHHSALQHGYKLDTGFLVGSWDPATAEEQIEANLKEV